MVREIYIRVEAIATSSLYCQNIPSPRQPRRSASRPLHQWPRRCSSERRPMTVRRRSSVRPYSLGSCPSGEGRRWSKLPSPCYPSGVARLTGVTGPITPLQSTPVCPRDIPKPVIPKPAKPMAYYGAHWLLLRPPLGRRQNTGRTEETKRLRWLLMEPECPLPSTSPYDARERR